jgi:GH18 family chitinase
MTAALATTYGPTVTDRALGYLDFINIMSYDKTGPWTKGHPGQHAPYEMAVSDLAYWTSTRKINRKKIILGVPFYGYLFGKDAVSAMPFSEIVAKFPGSEQEDSLMLKDGGLLYYNGLPTTRQKTRLAMKKAGGIMFWQLLQDAEGTLSLLNAIDETNGLSKRKR